MWSGELAEMGHLIYIPDNEELKDEQQYCTKIKNKDYLWQNCGYGFTQQSDILNDFCIMFFN